MPTAPATKLPSVELEQDLPLLALHDAVVFPGTLMQILLRDAPLAQHLKTHPEATVAIFVGKAGQGEPGEPLSGVSRADLHDVGVVAQVVSVARPRGESREESAGVVVVLRGLARARLDSIASGGPLVRVKVVPVEETATDDAELDALFLNLRHAVHEVMDQLRLPPELGVQIDAIPSAGELADFVSARLDVDVAEKAEILGTLDVKARVHMVLTKVVRRREVLKIRKSIDTQIQSDMGKKQREHLLREQMKAIERELGEGEGEDGESDVDALAARVAAASLSDEAREVAEKQLRRLRSLQSGSPEFGTVRTYLDWIVELPWTRESEDSPEVAAVRAVLDADHYGLEKVKRRILEYLAVRKLKSDKKGPILCLIGPPGVGKTSLGRSIAGALGRKFHRISLGGVHDEAAIRGHRRTYVGALPGNVIQGMKKVGVTNPVFMLDEVDKLGQGGMQGDPSSALLEVLDPEQNDTFSDHYLEIPYNLSNVMFIATANVGDTIPDPLRDRMEIIEIPGYTRLEKLAIARRHLVPKQLREHGISSDLLEITDDALAIVIDRYTREAGVRSLEKQIATIARGVAVRFAEGREEAVAVRGEEDFRAFLGQARHDDQRIERTSEAGVATGLAWTPVPGGTRGWSARPACEPAQRRPQPPAPNALRNHPACRTSPPVPGPPRTASCPGRARCRTAACRPGAGACRGRPGPPGPGPSGPPKQKPLPTHPPHPLDGRTPRSRPPRCTRSGPPTPAHPRPTRTPRRSTSSLPGPSEVKGPRIPAASGPWTAISALSSVASMTTRRTRKPETAARKAPRTCWTRSR